MAKGTGNIIEFAREVPAKHRSRITVGQLAKLVTKTQIKARIQAAYRAMNAALHELMREKKANGLCTYGISCMKRATHGGACKGHDVVRAQLTEERKKGKRKSRAYTTEYGRARLVEIERGKREAKRAKRKVA